jgi:MFS family permease
MFAINLSGPFFTLYMLDNLRLDVRYVTLYGSLYAAAYLLMLIGWGRLSDRIGNRPLLLAIGIPVSLTPLLWLAIDGGETSVWLWLPLLHLFLGGTWGAIDLCMNNLQLGVAPIARQSKYFALVAAIGGVSGALGTTAGGFLVQFADFGGFPCLFTLSGGLRLIALIPLIFVRERQE